MGLLSVLAAPFYYLIVYPVFYVAFIAYFILSLLASPFIYLGSLGLCIALIPFRILDSLKELLIYLGVASLAGAAIGLLLYSITSLTIEGLLDWLSTTSPPAPVEPKQKRREHRKHRKRQERQGHLALEDYNYTPQSDARAKGELWANWGWGLDMAAIKKSEPAHETILEDASLESELK